MEDTRPEGPEQALCWGRRGRGPAHLGASAQSGPTHGQVGSLRQRTRRAQRTECREATREHGKPSLESVSEPRMAKQKRKVTEMTEKKNKKLKKASAKEILMVPEVTLGTKEVHPEGGAVLGAGQETAPQLPVLTPEEKRVLERKQKKERRKEEKKRLRESGAAQSPPAKRSGAQLALDYLRGWAEKHDNWRFQKTRQTWLLLHMYDSNQVPDELFSTLLAYLEGLQGRARELTVQKAEALMQKLDEAGGMDPLPQGKTQRIRQVLQLLS